MDSESKTQRSDGPRSSARERILDAAERLFAAHGFAATTTQRLSKEAGTPSGLIFYYFETKQGLLRTLLEERSFLPEIRPLLSNAEDADPRSTLVAIGTGFLQALERERNLLKILFSQSLTDDAVYEQLAGLRGEAIALISAHLDDAIQDGHMAPVNTQIATRAFIYTLLFSALFNDVQDPQSLVEETADLLLKNRIPNDRRTP